MNSVVRDQDPEVILDGTYPCLRRRMSRVGVSAIKPERFSAVWMRPMCEYACGKLPN